MGYRAIGSNTRRYCPTGNNRTNYKNNMVEIKSFPLNDDEKLLLAKVIGEYLQLVAEKKRAAELDDIRLALDIATSLKYDGIIVKTHNRRRRAIAKQITDRMTSVAERMLGL